MPIYNVTSKTFDHECIAHRNGKRICFHKREAVPHETIERITALGQTTLVIVCPDGHREHLNNNLSEEEETSPTRDEASREQVRNVRALHKHQGAALSDSSHSSDRSHSPQ